MLSDAIQQRVALPKPPTLIAAPPSESAEYPAVAIWIEKQTLAFEQDEELQQDATGNLLIANTMDIDALDGSTSVLLDDQATISRIGMSRGSGRIWVGARLPAQRAELEEQVERVFEEDRAAPGRILLTLSKVMVGGKMIPFPWTVAALLTESEWTAEYAFGERLWSWTRFDLDVDILIPRNDPVVKELQLLFSQDINTPVVQPSDINNLKNLEKYDVDQAGDLTRI